MNKAEKLARELEHAAAVRLEHPSDPSFNLTWQPDDIAEVTRALRSGDVSREREIQTAALENAARVALNCGRRDIEQKIMALASSPSNSDGSIK